MLSKQVEKFQDYYKQIKKLVPKENIYCDDIYLNRYNFFILEDNYGEEIQYQLDLIIADMYGHIDEEFVPLYSVLILPQEIIDDQHSLIAEDFFKQKTQNQEVLAMSTKNLSKESHFTHTLYNLLTGSSKTDPPVSDSRFLTIIENNTSIEKYTSIERSENTSTSIVKECLSLA